jgi:hypothetical protein
MIISAREKVFILPKSGSIAPSLWLSFENPQTILWKKENTSYTTRGYIPSGLLWRLGKRNERGDLVVNVA